MRSGKFGECNRVRKVGHTCSAAAGPEGLPQHYQKPDARAPRERAGGVRVWGMKRETGGVLWRKRTHTFPWRCSQVHNRGE
jgi:hypothetical protein